MSIHENIIKLNLFPQRKTVTYGDAQVDSDEEQVQSKCSSSGTLTDTAHLLDSIVDYYRCHAAADRCARRKSMTPIPARSFHE
jgi:hypothetical protein